MLGLAVVIYLATLPQMLEQITVGTFISFITAMFMILTPLKRLTKLNSKLQAGIAAADSVFTMLDQKPEADTGTQHLERAKGDIRFQQVGFQYNATSRKVLDNISFEVKAGQTIAFCWTLW